MNNLPYENYNPVNDTPSGPNEFNPLRATMLISPIDAGDLGVGALNDLYREEQLTRDEFLVLDYFGTTMLIKRGAVTMSFQGLKRLISLHQARLTKALNRLVQKELLVKVEAGYSLTENGVEVFNRLYDQFRQSKDVLPNQIYSHVSHGQIQGPRITKDQQELVAERLIGKWFGKFRFTTKTDYPASFELGWISTDGSISASLIVGPENNLRLSVSAPSFTESQNEQQILINHLSHSIESSIDAPVVFTSHSIYENREKISREIDDAKIPFAG